MEKQMVRRLRNGNKIYKVQDKHGTPRYRVLRGKHWVGKTNDGGYISARAAMRFGEENG